MTGRSPNNGVGAVAGSRVLVVAPEPFYEDRGTPISVRYLLEALSEIGIAADVLTYPLGESVRIRGVRYIRTGNPLGFRSVPIGLSGRKLFLDVLLAARLAGQLRRERYLCVHAVEEMAFAAAVLARRHGIPVIYDMQSSLPEQLHEHRPLRLPPLPGLFRAAERWLLARVDCVVCSAGLAERVRSTGRSIVVREWHFPGAELPPVPPASPGVRESLNIPERARIVLYSGTFEPYQGLTELGRAVPRVLAAAPDAIFVLVGARSCAEIEAFRAALDPAVRDRVLLLERQPRERIPAFLAAADVLVSPRRGGENVPLKIFDYLTAGKAIVASDIPAHRQVVDERRAVLVPPTAEDLARAIADLLNDPARATSLGAAARSYSDANLGWQQFVQRIRSIYAPIVGTRPAVSRGAAGAS